MSTQVITSGQVPVSGMLRTNSVTKVYIRPEDARTYFAVLRHGIAVGVGLGIVDEVLIHWRL